MTNSPPTEFELQATGYILLLNGLKPYGLSVRGNWTWPVKDDRRRRLLKPVFDLAVYRPEDDALLLTVEYKRSAGSSSSYQGDRYEAITGLPCIYVRGPEAAVEILDTVLQALGFS